MKVCDLTDNALIRTATPQNEEGPHKSSYVTTSCYRPGILPQEKVACCTALGYLEAEVNPALSSPELFTRAVPTTQTMSWDRLTNAATTDLWFPQLFLCF